VLDSAEAESHKIVIMARTWKSFGKPQPGKSDLVILLFVTSPRNLRPIRLSRRSEPFDSDEFIYELKVDGFRALAHIDGQQGELVSRNGNVFRGFADLAEWIAKHLHVESAVIDGEIACVDDGGRPVFRDLLFRKKQCVFIAFDLLFLNGKDLRTLPLVERKAALKKLLRRRKRSRILYLDHVESDGRLLFEQVVKMDLEGIVCKRKDSPYKVTEKPSRYWIKVKNSRYSQLEGREELFERRA
jgi:bifunctional non-homologous end joining protein LigD